MPFKSQQQRKLCYALKAQGKAGSWDCDEWSKATGKKKLPKHVAHKVDEDIATKLDEVFSERKLTAKTRNNLSDSSFVYPSERRYPIHDISHTRNALSRSSGKPEEKKVRAAVYAKYPSLKIDGAGGGI